MSSKPGWIYRQSGVVPVYRRKVVLITARKSKRWIIPKGVIEKNMSPYESAAKEAYEEAGVIGTVKKRELGRYTYEKWGGTFTVRVYPLHVEKLLDTWSEMHERKRKIVTPVEAVEMVCFRELAAMIQEYCKILQKQK